MTNILIADDDRLNLATMADGLRAAGYIVCTAEDGMQALELCAKHKPDLAILDIRMPKLDGIQTAKKMQVEFDVPYIFLSAYSDNETVDAAIVEGALGYLVKPVDIEQLNPTIQTALSRSAELKELRRSRDHLDIALKKDRDVSEAIGILVGKGLQDKDEAFDKLRNYARSNERKLVDVAKALVEKVSDANKMIHDIKSN